jgi:hypothetical protein
MKQINGAGEWLQATTLPTRTDSDTGSRKNPTAAKDEEGEQSQAISCSIGTAQVATVADNLILV